MKRLPHHFPCSRISRLTEIPPVTTPPCVITPPPVHTQPVAPKKTQRSPVLVTTTLPPPLQEVKPPVSIIRGIHRTPRVVTTTLAPELPPTPVTGLPSVSVLIGFRGHVRYPALRHVIESFRDQTTPVEIIVVEQDIEPQHQEELTPLVDQYLFTYSNTLYNRSWAFNCGAKLSQSDYLILHDGDLIVPKDYCGRSLQEIGSHLALTGWYKINYLSAKSSQSYPQGTWEMIGSLLNTQTVGGSTLIRRQDYFQVGGMDERFEGWGGEDNAFYDKIIRLGSFGRASSTGPCLLHSHHSQEGRHHNHGSINNAVVVEYRHATTKKSMQTLISRQPPIGNPDRGLISPVIRQRKFRVLMLYDVVGWFHYNHANFLAKFAPPHWDVVTGDQFSPFQEQDWDLILALDWRQTWGIRSCLLKQKNSPVLVSLFAEHWDWHEGEFLPLVGFSDHVIVINQETYDHFHHHPKTSYISGGVDREVFHPCWVPWGKRTPKVLWCGSWANHVEKGLHLIQEVAQTLGSQGVSVDVNIVDSFHAPRTPQQMADWYRTGTVFVTTSRTEGGPQTGLEAASCKLALVSTRVGIMPELIQDKISGVLVDRDVSSILAGVNYALEHGELLVSRQQETIERWNWLDRASRTFTLFDTLVTKGKDSYVHTP